MDSRPAECISKTERCTYFRTNSGSSPLKPRQHGALQILYCIVLYCTRGIGLANLCDVIHLQQLILEAHETPVPFGQDIIGYL